MAQRPTPVTTTDALLSLVLDELQGLRSDVAAHRGGAPVTPEVPGTPVELREPDPAPRQRQRTRGRSQT
jgi:hypothetical protein